MTTSTASLHISQRIGCPAQRAYAFASDLANLPLWAAGLGGSITQVDGEWRVPSPDGDVLVRMVPANEHGVLDHTVVLPDGTSSYNPMRVLADGEGCEVVFTLRRRPTMSDDDLAADAAAVAADLRTLKRILEQAPDS